MSPRYIAKHLFRASVFAVLALINACAPQRFSQQDGPPPFHVDFDKIHDAVPVPVRQPREYNPRSYVTNGHRYYVLKSAQGYSARGIASWYGMKFNGRYTSTNERYNPLAMTAASTVLPIPCYVRVTNLANGKSVVVKVNDRGPFAAHRIMDLSYVAAAKLDYANRGTAYVQITAVDPTHPYGYVHSAEVHGVNKIRHLASLPQSHAIVGAHHMASASSSHAITKVHHLTTLAQSKLYLQLGAFTHIANAEKLKREIRHYTSRPTHISEGSYHHHPIYRVEIGPFAGTDESAYLHQRLKRAGLGNATIHMG